MSSRVLERITPLRFSVAFFLNLKFAPPYCKKLKKFSLFNLSRKLQEVMPSWFVCAYTGTGFLTKVFFHLTDKRHKSQWKVKLEKFRPEKKYLIFLAQDSSISYKDAVKLWSRSRNQTVKFHKCCYVGAQKRWSYLHWKPINEKQMKFKPKMTVVVE